MGDEIRIEGEQRQRQHRAPDAPIVLFDHRKITSASPAPCKDQQRSSSQEEHEIDVVEEVARCDGFGRRDDADVAVLDRVEEPVGEEPLRPRRISRRRPETRDCDGRRTAVGGEPGRPGVDEQERRRATDFTSGGCSAFSRKSPSSV